jgi:hypothetical protein
MSGKLTRTVFSEKFNPIDMLKVALLLLLVAILYQDVKLRAVHWVFFPLLAAAALCVQKWPLYWPVLLFNFTFLAGMLLLLTVYVSLRTGKLTDITQGYFSWGDILFLLAVIPLFPFTTYMLFFTCGTFLTLLIHLLVTQIKKQETVPYAGYMALIALVYVCFEESIHRFLFAHGLIHLFL